MNPTRDPPRDALWFAADVLARSNQRADRTALSSVMQWLGPPQQLGDADLRRCAHLAIAAGDYRRTLAIGRELEHRGSNDPTALFAIAVAQWESGDEPGALATAAPLWAPGATDAQLCAGARFFLRVNDVDMAETLLSLVREPAACEFLALARRLREEGHLERSLEAFERSRSAHPADVDASVEQGLALAELAAVEERWAPPAIRQPLPRVRARVLHLVGRAVSNSLRGSAVRSHCIGRAQARAGLEVHVLAAPGFPRTAAVDGAPPCDVLDEVRYHRLADPGARRSQALDERLCRQIHLASELVEELRPAVLHPHSPFANALVALELSRRFDLPVVYEVSGLPEERVWSPPHSRARIDTGAVPRRLERVCRQRADHVITLADVMKRHIVAGGVPYEQVTVVPNAADASQFTPDDRDHALCVELGIPDGVPVVGSVLTFMSHGALPCLIRSVARLDERGRRVHCLLIGDGTLRHVLDAEVDALELQDRFTFAGPVEHDDIARYYRLVDVFVVTAPNDTVSDLVAPLEPYEAMASECAVAMARTSALSEMGVEGETARFFTPADPESLADVLETFLEHPAERARIARGARVWVTEYRTWEHAAEQYKGIYEQVGAL